MSHQPHPCQKTGLGIPPGQSQHHSQPHCPLECLRTRGARGPPPARDDGRLQHRDHQEQTKVCRSVLMLPATPPGHLQVTAAALTTTGGWPGPILWPGISPEASYLPITCSLALCSSEQGDKFREIKCHLPISFHGIRIYQGLSRPPSPPINKDFLNPFSLGSDPYMPITRPLLSPATWTAAGSPG